MVCKSFGRLMHRIGRPPHHALRFRTNLWMAWRDYRSGTALFRGEFTQDTVAELVKFLLAHTGLPRVYRKLDRWRRRNRPHVLDTLALDAARLFFSHLNAMAVAQSQANAALQDRTEVTSFCNWQGEFDEPDRRRNPDFYRNVLADGIDIMQLVSGQPT